MQKYFFYPIKTPFRLKKLFLGAVNAARGSNEAELTRLKNELEKINQETEFLQGRHKELEEEHAVLQYGIETKLFYL